MSTGKLAVGELVPLTLQLGDGAVGLFPRALVYDASGALIATKDLTHIANGRYANDTLVMPGAPNNAYIAATYIVYTDPGRTVLAQYGRWLDEWQLSTQPTAAAIAAAVMATVLETTPGGYAITVARALRGLFRQLVAAPRAGYSGGAVAVKKLDGVTTSHTINKTADGWTSVVIGDLD